MIAIGKVISNRLTQVYYITWIQSYQANPTLQIVFLDLSTVCVINTGNGQWIHKADILFDYQCFDLVRLRTQQRIQMFGQAPKNSACIPPTCGSTTGTLSYIDRLISAILTFLVVEAFIKGNILRNLKHSKKLDSGLWNMIEDNEHTIQRQKRSLASNITSGLKRQCELITSIKEQATVLRAMLNICRLVRGNTTTHASMQRWQLKPQANYRRTSEQYLSRNWMNVTSLFCLRHWPTYRNHYKGIRLTLYDMQHDKDNDTDTWLIISSYYSCIVTVFTCTSNPEPISRGSECFCPFK